MIFHLVLNGVAESSLSIGLDIVSVAARVAGSQAIEVALPADTLQQRVVSIDGRPVCSALGRPVAVDGAIVPGQLGATDVLIVPGWLAASEDSTATLLSSEEGRQAITALRQVAASGSLMAASCSATFLLAAAGLLDGLRATTAWWLAGCFHRHFPAVRLSAEQMVVEAPRILTAGSAFAHADLMLAVLARLAGSVLPRQVASYLVLDSRPSQSRYMVTEHLRVADPVLQKVEHFILRHLDRPITLKALASEVAVSPRTLARRMQAALGLTPNAFVQHLRISHATHLLETTGMPVDEIAARVGYADPAAFRRVFRRLAGESPRSRRSRHQTG